MMLKNVKYAKLLTKIAFAYGSSADFRRQISCLADDSAAETDNMGKRLVNNVQNAEKQNHLDNGRQT